MAALNNIYIFGAGGFALCCADALLSRSYSEFTIVSQTEPSSDVFPKNSQYPHILEAKLDWSKVGYAFVAIGDNFIRKRMVDKIKAQSPGVKFASCVHSSALVGTASKLGVGVYLGAGAIVGPAVTIGDFCVLNNSVTVEHNCTIGSFVNIGTGSNVAGTVKIGDRAILGVAANILNNLELGEDSLVASGACVIQNVSSKEVVMGVPAQKKGLRNFGDTFL